MASVIQHLSQLAAHTTYTQIVSATASAWHCSALAKVDVWVASQRVRQALLPCICADYPAQVAEQHNADASKCWRCQEARPAAAQTDRGSDCHKENPDLNIYGGQSVSLLSTAGVLSPQVCVLHLALRTAGGCALSLHRTSMVCTS
jgi:hypothetical protein